MMCIEVIHTTYAAHGHLGACRDGHPALYKGHHGRGQERRHPVQRRLGPSGRRSLLFIVSIYVCALPQTLVSKHHFPHSHCPPQRERIHRLEEKIRRRVGVGSYITQKRLMEEMVG